MGAHGKPVKGGTRGNVGGKGPLGGRVGKGKAKAKRVGQGMTRGLEEHIRGRNDKACFPLPQVQGSGRGRGVTIGPSRTGGPSHTHPSEEYHRNMSRGDLPKSNIFHVPRPDPRVGVARVDPRENRPHTQQEETFPKTVNPQVDPS